MARAIESPFVRRLLATLDAADRLRARARHCYAEYSREHGFFAIGWDDLPESVRLEWVQYAQQRMDAEHPSTAP